MDLMEWKLSLLLEYELLPICNCPSLYYYFSLPTYSANVFFYYYILNISYYILLLSQRIFVIYLSNSSAFELNYKFDLFIL